MPEEGVRTHLIARRHIDNDLVQKQLRRLLGTCHTSEQLITSPERRGCEAMQAPALCR